MTVGKMYTKRLSECTRLNECNMTIGIIWLSGYDNDYGENVYEMTIGIY